MKRLGTGFQLANQCWGLLRANRTWLMFPLLSTLGLIVITIVFGLLAFILGIPNALSKEGELGAAGLPGVVLLFLYYVASYTVVIYSNTALISVVLMKIRGDKPDATTNDGFTVANNRMGAILGFAILSATVGMISRAISQSGRDSKNIGMQIVTAILASLVQAAWSLVSFLVIPIYIIENVGTFEALKRSWALFRKTWGEQVVGNFSLGFLGCLMTLVAMAPGALIAALGGMAGSPVILVGGVGILLIGIGFISLILGAISSIFQAVLYQYATEGQTGGLLDPELVRQAFVPKAA